MNLRVLSLAFLLLTTAAHAQADSAAHPKVGDKAPPISVPLPSGETFSLTPDSGKVTVVNFWATWCDPCMFEMPQLEKQIWQKHKASPDFAMVAITDQSKRAVAHFQKKHAAYSFPLAYDPHRTAYKLFAGKTIPRTYVVDRHGLIVYQSIGYRSQNIDDLDHAIQSALDAQ